MKHKFGHSCLDYHIISFAKTFLQEVQHYYIALNLDSIHSHAIKWFATQKYMLIFETETFGKHILFQLESDSHPETQSSFTAAKPIISYFTAKLVNSQILAPACDTNGCFKAFAELPQHVFVRLSICGWCVHGIQPAVNFVLEIRWCLYIMDAEPSSNF